MHDADDVDFWSQYEHLDVTRSELETIHHQLIIALGDGTLEHEEIAEIMAICENIEVLLIRSGAMTKEEIDEAHEEVDGDE